MAIDFASMLLQPTKTSAWNLSGGGDSTAREQLKFMKEKFEYEKKQAEEQKELNRLAAKAAETKERLEREAAVQATLLGKQQEARSKFGELAGQGKVQQAQAMVPYLDSLDVGVSNLGDVGGLPVFEMQSRAEQAALAQGAMPPPSADETAEQSLARLDSGDVGYRSGERGVMEPPEGIASSDQTDMSGRSVADRVAATFGMPGEKTATRGPDEEDYTGAVARNVIDLPAMQAETLARLNPALKARVEAMPEALQPGAKANAEAIGGLGLEATDALAEQDKAMADPVSIYNQELNLKAQKEKFRETRDDLTEKDKSSMRKEGRSAAEQRAKDDDVTGGLKALRVIDEMEDILDNEGPGSKEDDTMIAGALMSIQDVKGIPSDRDLAFAFGMGKASLLSQVSAKIQEVALGGFSDQQRAAIKNFISRVRESQKEKVSAYLDTGNLLGELNEHEQEGYRGYSKRLVPGYVYNDWLDKQPKKEPGKSGASGGAEFNQALDTQARAGGFDPDKIRAVTRHESGNQGDAQSSAGAAGVFQLMGDRAREVGTSTEDLLEMSPAEQVPYGLEYLKNTGLKGDAPARDYALAFAAPAYIGKSDDTEIRQYKKGTKRGDDVRAQNPGWVPKDGGDITVGSILDFYGLRGATDAPGKKTEAAKLPEPKNDTEKRIRALLERGR